MSITIQTTTDTKDAANFIAGSILNQLKSGKHVLFFVAGGSSIPVGVKVSEIVRKHPHQNLTVTLTDERYGPIDHFNSNYFKLTEKGFNLPEANIIPILIDDDRNITTEKFNTRLAQELGKAQYKIGLFGVGSDGHTAGILPESVAVQSSALVSSYNTAVFSRITITPKAIEQLDEVVVWMQGKEKWEAIKNLSENLEKDIDISKMPAQILKKVPLVTIFTDYQKQ